MTPRSRMHGLHREAWQFGRGLRDALLADYACAYGEPSPPPAVIGGELLTDFLGARLAYDALPLTVFLPTLRRGPQTAFAGMRPRALIACYRDPQAGRLRGEALRREVFAEEAGRAAAVSFPHLLRDPGFRDFLDGATRGRASRTAGWRTLYRAAAQIGVNISALVRQLEAEGFLRVDRSGERPVLHPQPGLGNLRGTGGPR